LNQGNTPQQTRAESVYPKLKRKPMTGYNLAGSVNMEREQEEIGEQWKDMDEASKAVSLLPLFFI
jgi:hypothetical protein